MRTFMLFFLLTFHLSQLCAQKHKPKQKYGSIALITAQPGNPFSRFSSLLYKDFHPGFEVGLGVNWWAKKRHDIFQEFKLGYFFHRFIQHGIPLYTDVGYRYKFNKTISSEILLGGGYQHAICATQKFKLNENGEYKNNAGIGRMQAIAHLSFRFNYTIHKKNARPFCLYIQYQQQIQTPFAKSYIPLLPYNSMMLGVARPLKKKSS
ncbi:MAG: hypothetical protein ABIP80_02900 [Ferruginibacter sp.]